MMTQEIKDIYETWFLKTTGFLPEQAIDALEEKDKHYAVAIGQLSKRNQELEDQLKEVQGKLNTALGHLDQQQALYSDLHEQIERSKVIQGIRKDRKHLREQLEAVHKQSVRLYNQGYLAGHNDTVEGTFTDIYQCDMDTIHVEEVAALQGDKDD